MISLVRMYCYKKEDFKLEEAKKEEAKQRHLELIKEGWTVAHTELV